MTTIEELKQYANEEIKKRPELKQDIRDLVQLAIDEIEEGGSEVHEVQLAQTSIEQLED